MSIAMKSKYNVTNSYLLLTVITGLLVFCTRVDAGDLQHLSAKGTKQFGFNFGYGYSFETNRDIRFANIFPYFGYVMTDPVGKGWYRGTLEGIVEGAFSYVFKDQRAHSLGFTLMARYNFLMNSEKASPYFQFGFGMIGTNLTMRNFGSNFNFTTNAAAGMQYFLNPNSSLNFEWRFQHISNAGIDKDNAGLNMNMFFIGYSCLF